MVRRLLLSVVVVGLGLTPLASAPPPPQSPLVIDRARVFRPGELLVGFRPGAGPPEISGVYQLHGLEEKENLDPGPRRPALRRVAFPLATAEDLWEQTERVITRLMRHPLVRFAEPNYIFHTSQLQLPNDPRFGELYGLHNTGQTTGRPDADVDAPEAWGRTTGSPVIVFVIDTGVDYLHEDLAGNLWTNTAEASGVPNVDDDGNGYVDDVHGINAITGSGDPADDMGHGTHVAGTIGAEGNNGIGVVGVTWDVRIGACKFLDNTGSGTLADAVECFQYVNSLKAAGHNILVTNNSWGGGGFSQALEDAMAGLDQPTIQPILHACAAGNENTNNDVFPSYPPSYDLPNIVAVAATDHQDVYAGFSNYGATSVDVAAPGVAILSTVPSSGDPCCSDPTGYRLLSGTSMATPFVSGAAALVWSANPGLTAAQVRSRLLGGVDYIGELGANAVKPTVTDSRLNVSSALEVGEDLVPPAAVTLTVTAIGLSSATLGWDATGDDDFTGTASSFDVRYSTNAITDANWSSTIRAIGEPAPQLSGSPQTFTVSGLSPGQTYYFALKARDNVGNESILSNIAVASTVTGTTVFEDDMSVAGAWVVAGTPSPPLWHRSQRRSNSPAYSWWYGREATGTYNTGAANWSTLTTSIDLAGYGEAVLTFAEWSQVEATPQFDRTRVQASIDGATWNTVFESHGTNGAWAERLVDLSAYAGQTVQLRFYLDTFDPLLNDYEGWYIDDVRVVGLPLDGFFAGFSGNPTVGFAPLQVTFTDQSVSNAGTISAWVWTFGAGTAGSTDKNPEYTYANPGSYTVTLTVTDSNGSQAARTKTGYITVRRTARVASVTYAREGSRGKDLLITLKVVNWAGAAIGGATVTANVNRGSVLAKSFMGTTNLDGTVIFKLRNAGSGCYSTVVTALSSTNHEWDGLTPPNSSCN